MPTKKQIEQIKRVCGENYEQSDIPTIWRNRDEKKMYRFESLAEELKKTLTNN